jgi:hypothetical protein
MTHKVAEPNGGPPNVWVAMAVGNSQSAIGDFWRESLGLEKPVISGTTFNSH